MSITDQQDQAAGQDVAQAAEEVRLRIEFVPIEEIQAHPGNPREEIAFPAGFLDSLRERGIRTPVLLTTDPQNPEAPARLLIDGHRRVAGAAEVGITQIPAIIEPDINAAHQFLDMLITSIHKAPLTATEEAAALISARDAGVTRKSLEKVAGRKRTGNALTYGKLAQDTKDAVKAAAYEWSLEELAALAEFDDDAEATSRLIAATAHGQFRHQIERERSVRENRAKGEKMRAELTAAGVRIVTDLGDDACELYRLRTPEGEAITLAEHSACPGHVAYFPTAGARVEYYCVDLAANGHVDRFASQSRTDTTPADPQAARVARRNVIQGNRDHESAQTVRREWLKTLLSRNLSAKAAEAIVRFSTEAYLTSPAPIIDAAGSAKARTVQAEILGLSADSRETAAEAVQTANPRRLAPLAFAPVAAAYETAFNGKVWRKDGDHSRDWNLSRRADARRWLEFLTTQGYTLSAIEQAIVNDTEYNALAETIVDTTGTLAEDDADEDQEDDTAE